MHALQPYLEALAGLAHQEGGWGYASGQAARLEPTCLALLALSLERDQFTRTIEQGQAFLRKCATPEQTYEELGGREEAVWPTALVLFVQAECAAPSKELQKIAERLLAVHCQKPQTNAALEIQDINTNLLGWPWAESNFSWVEPTAWACLALRRAGFGDHPRVRDGLHLLLDRAFDDGGVNYGNRHVLGLRTEPIPGPTALMLLALQGHSQEPRVAAAVHYLLRHALASHDPEHLCWSNLALDCHRDQPDVAGALPSLDEKIIRAYQTRVETPWLVEATIPIALTALALATEQSNPFRLPIADTRLAIDEEKLHYAIGNLQFKIRRKPLGTRLASAFRGLAIEAVGRLRQTPPKTAVHIARATDYNVDLAAILQEQYAVFRERVPLRGKRVVLKPNLVEYRRDRVINTHPHVVGAAIELCRREGASEIVVAEGPGHWRNVEYLVRESGLGDVLRHHHVRFKDLNHDDPVKMPNLGRLTRLESLYLSRTVTAADVLISLPKLKTHHWAGATLSLKNLFGTLPGICYGWPKNELHWRGIENSIVDIALTRPPDLAIVDGIIGMEGDGPLNGTAKPFGALIMGSDPLAVDATCCRLMQLDPERIGYLILGYQKKLGLFRPAEIQQVGERVESLAQPFATVPHFQELKMALSA